jgi:hypothetical protein
VTTEHYNFIATAQAGCFTPRYAEPASRFCEQSLHFDEPNNRGPFTLLGREYAREPIDSFTDASVTDGVGVFGSQSGKTGIVMGGAACVIKNEPSRIFWVMPTRDTVLKFSRTRWMPMLRGSPIMAELIPTGRRRHDFSSFAQQIGSSIVDMAWSNSPAMLASVPARMVILDECDKFNEGGAKEADAVNLSEQRTKAFPDPKRYKFSTPTILEGAIWQELLKSDLRRRFMPCPHCGKFVVFAWSAAYTILPKTGHEAYVTWDKEAKRGGNWDLDRVERSARYQCWNCGGHILDGHKTLMDRNGEWRPTQTGRAGYRGWHLPSMYAPSVETNVGKLAVKFLQAKHSLLGLQGFINGDLAEPYQSQDTQTERIELITTKLEVTAEWRKQLTVDCQQKAPLFWFVVRAFDEHGNSEGIDAGPLDSWKDVEANQEFHKVKAVAVDSGFGARSEHDVYFECARHSETVERPDQRPVMVGWIPLKGMPGRKRWMVDKQLMPYALRPIDPFYGRSGAGLVEMALLEYSGDFFKDILDSLRKGKGGYKWTVLEAVATEEYWRHLDAEIKQPRFNKMTGKTVYEWQPRSKWWPNHLLDCEVAQIVLATFFGSFKEIAK